MPIKMSIALGVIAGAAIGTAGYLLDLPMTANFMLGVIAGAAIVLLRTRLRNRKP